MSQALIRLLLALVMLTSLAATASAAESDAEVAWRLLDASLLTLVDVVRADEAVDGLALSDAASGVLTPELRDHLGNFFLDHGIAFWSLESAAPLPAGAARLEFEIDGAGVEYLQRRRGWFGLRGDKTLRRVSVSCRAAITGADGLWIHRGRPARDAVDWVDTDAIETLGADRPSWMDGDIWTAPDDGGGWLEKGVVAGLVTGVAILYFDGAR